MRVTTQMVENSARKAGIPYQKVSLLDYMDTSGTTASESIQNLLSQKSSTVSKTNYEKLEQAADSLQEQAGQFLESAGDSLFDKAAESGSTADIEQAVKSLVESYNDTVSAAGKAGGTLNDYYLATMKELASENSEALSNAGITLLKDGTLKLDAEKLSAAGLETLQEAFGTGTFMTKLSILASRMADNAQANVESAAGGYTADGSLYSGYTGSKYDLWG